MQKLGILVIYIYILTKDQLTHIIPELTHFDNSMHMDSGASDRQVDGRHKKRELHEGSWITLPGREDGKHHTCLFSLA